MQVRVRLVTKLLTPEEVAEATQLSVETVRRLAREGALPGAKKFGRSWRIVAHKLEAWLDEDAPAEGTMVEPSNGRRLRAIEGGRW